MSAICGIVDMNKRSTDFGVLRSMGRAMVLRGADQSGAYVNGGVGLLCNRMILGESEQARQPHTVTRGGKNFTVCFDGELDGMRSEGGEYRYLDYSSDAEMALEYYLSFGNGCFSRLRGDFALAICDEYRGEVLLARSEGSSRPLYFSWDGGRLVFASEIKGMLCAMPWEVRISSEALKTHLFSPAGTCTGGQIYSDIEELPIGSCAVFSRLGMSAFEISAVAAERADIGSFGDIIVPSHVEQKSASELRYSLAEALVAFDYPQFDHGMIAFVDALKDARAKQKRTVRISDGTCAAHSRYSSERADRLGGFCGVRVYSVPSEEDCAKSAKHLKRLDKALDGELERTNIPLLERIYGSDVVERVRGERDIAARIRQKGMLCQSVMWAEHSGRAMVFC